MFDLGLAKLALIGIVALVVIGPARLPRVARTLGALVGRAQRYIDQIKTEVSREIELEELRCMKTEFEHTAQHVEQSIHDHVRELNEALPLQATRLPVQRLQQPRSRWRSRRITTPAAGKRAHLQSGAARVMRYTPTRAQPTRFF